MSAPAPPPPRHSGAERRLRRTARTLSVLASVTGSLGLVGFGVLTKLELVERFWPLFLTCLVVCAVALAVRLLWGLFVLVRKAVLRRPRRQAMATMAARIGWRWFATRRSIPAETRTALLLIDPEKWNEHQDTKPRYTELAYGAFAGRPAVSVHIERDSRLLPDVDQVVALQMPGSLPTLRITDRAHDPYGYGPGQQFESARFNDAWGVHADDERYASAFTHPQMMHLLNRLDPSISGLYVRGSWLVSRAPVAFGPDLLQVHLDALHRVIEAVPDWVWAEFGYRALSATAPPWAAGRRAV